MVASLGFEPKQADPESAVLPLHHEALNFSQKTDFKDSGICPIKAIPISAFYQLILNGINT